MTIKHHVDLVIKFIDAYTDKPLLPAFETYKLNDIPIKPTKKMTPYVIFTNIVENHHYSKLGDKNTKFKLVWHHPYYESVAISLEDEDQLIRAIPNEKYPYPDDITAILGSAPECDLLEIIHDQSRNRFLLKSNIVAEKYMDLSQSYDSDLMGRKFLFTEEHHEQIVRIGLDNVGYYSIPNLEFPYTPACEIYEIIEAIPQSNGRFMVPIKNLRALDTETIEFKMRLHYDAKVKSTTVKIKKDVITDVGSF